ncbi:MAG: hypothetical protein KGL39_19245 [Patescibacteria group bacterium]|nr:hypothetical protein [Patescibacteria group bacterium]
MNETEISWQAPPFERPDSVKLAFVKQAIEAGRKWNEDQCSSENLKRGLDILSGKSGSTLSGKWATITTGDLKRGIREIVETLANIRPFWGYQTDNDAFRDEANMMNKVTKAVYLESFVDRAIRDALQFAAVSGAGFIYPYFSRSKFGSGEGRFVFKALGQPDVLPVQLPRDKNYQEAYIVTIRSVTGVAEAHARFPMYQWALIPFAEKQYGKTSGGSQRKSDKARWQMHSIETQLEQYCDVYFTYILDLRINYGAMDNSGKPLLDEAGNPIGQELAMGQEGTSWFYKVPYVGQTIERFENGQMVTRSATEEDCRVYPYRRLMISCDKALMYDGPAFDMHGMVPVIPLYLDDWAWEGSGYSLFRGTASTQDAIDDLVRSIYRIAMSRANPGKSYNTDITSGDKGAKLSSRQAEAIDPFDPNMTFGVDGDTKDPVMRPPMPEWCYNIPDWVPKVIEFLEGNIAKQLGLDQIQSLQKLKANIDDPEKLLEAEGPVVTGTSRSMEMGLRDLGVMMKFLILQYMTTARTMQYVGASGVAPEVFDYSPEMLIPSHVQGEQTIDANNNPVPSKVDVMTRVRDFANNLRFFITPHSLHYIAQKEQKLNLLALLGKGVPVDPETIAAQFDLPNWGSIEGSTIKEKVFNWAKEQLVEKADIAKLEKGLGLAPPPEEGPGQGKGGGRPNTYKKAPKAAQKGTASGGRVVVKTS